MRSTVARIVVAALVGALAMSSVAAARPGSRSFHRTFPIASRLCAESARGHAPKRLKGDEPQINQACGTLETSYSQAVVTVVGAEQAFRTGVQNARLQANAACLKARQSHNAAACRAARQAQRQTVQSLRATRRAAVVQYHQSIEAARKAFWATIRSLRGGTSITPDQPRPNAPVPPTSA